MIGRALVTLALLATLTGNALADVPAEPASKGSGVAFWIAIGTAIGLAIFVAIRSQTKK